MKQEPVPVFLGPGVPRCSPQEPVPVFPRRLLLLNSEKPVLAKIYLTAIVRLRSQR